MRHPSLTQGLLPGDVRLRGRLPEAAHRVGPRDRMCPPDRRDARSPWSTPIPYIASAVGATARLVVWAEKFTIKMLDYAGTAWHTELMETRTGSHHTASELKGMRIDIVCERHPDATIQIYFDSRYARVQCGECGIMQAIIEYKNGAYIR